MLFIHSYSFGGSFQQLKTPQTITAILDAKLDYIRHNYTASNKTTYSTLKRTLVQLLADINNLRSLNIALLQGRTQGGGVGVKNPP